MNISEMTIIGSGAQADVYLHEKRAVKIYKPGYQYIESVDEAEFQNEAYCAGLPVPVVYGRTECNGRVAIIMEYIKGRPLGEIIQEDQTRVRDYLSLAVDLQLKIHSLETVNLPDQHDKLRTNIMENPYLDEMHQQKLINQLVQLDTGNQICHGDFHVQNLIQTEDGLKIIDWVDASSGNTLADVCRSYLLYLLYRKQMAEPYLNLYCTKANVSRTSVLKWMPAIAGARLNENVTPEHITMLLDLVDVTAF